MIHLITAVRTLMRSECLSWVLPAKLKMRSTLDRTEHCGVSALKVDHAIADFLVYSILYELVWG